MGLRVYRKKKMMSDNGEHGLSWKAGDQPVSNLYDDMFYSPDDGRAEAEHVFLSGNDFPARWEDGADCHICELGFGTGLNFLEVWRQWRKHRQAGQHLTFTSFEAHPLKATSIDRSHQPWPEIGALSADLLEAWPSDLQRDLTWNADEQTVLQVLIGEAGQRVQDLKVEGDAWFLDGFAPSKNPDMWSGQLMMDVFQKTAPGGTFATYTSAGWVRRNLEDAGFAVEKRPGFGRKREMVVGRKASV